VKRWWVRWYGRPGYSFEYHGPWWISGWAGEDQTPIFVAAVCADNEDAAKEAIEASHDDGAAGIYEWSFANERADDWEPFCDRFPRAKWMKWPWPAGSAPTKGERP
jgi:hypothetical protein